MKPAVRSKVANGLVIFLLMPRAAETAVEAFETYGGMFDFSADDAFDTTVEISSVAVAQAPPPDDDPSGGDPSGGDPTGGDPTGCEPPGDDPSGGDPSGGDPSGGDSMLIVNAPLELVTAEDGTADLFELSMEPDPGTTRYFAIDSTRPGEAQPVPDVVRFDDDACFPQTIRVVGQNDGTVDPSGGDPSGGDPSGGFFIDIRDEQDVVVAQVPGVNLDNDNYPGVSVDVIGPRSLADGDSTIFTVFAANVGRTALSDNSLVIEPSSGLQITNWAASLLSGTELKAKAKLENGVLTFKKVELGGADTIMVAVDATMNSGGVPGQKLTARFVKDSAGLESDDDHRVRTAVP